MRTGLLLSLALHLAVVLLAWLGLPSLFERSPMMDQPVTVQVVRVGEETKAPPPAPEAKPEPEPEPEPPKAEAPEPEPEPMPAPPPAPEAPPPPPPPPQPAAPEPVPEPEPEPAPPPPEPEPEPQPQKMVAVPKPKPTPPKPAPEPEPKKPEPPKPAPEPEPEPKKQKPKRDDFDSLLKTVEEFKEQPREQPQNFAKAVREAVNLREERVRARSSDAALTLSEIDAIRAQIQRNWNVPAGARDAEDLVVEVYVELNPDGSVVEARIVDTGRYASDPFFRTAADSARRAVLLTNRIKGLPQEKYSRWRSMILTFNPKDMIY